MLDTGFFTPPSFSIIFGCTFINPIQFSGLSICICLKYFDFFFHKNEMKINKQNQTLKSRITPNRITHLNILEYYNFRKEPLFQKQNFRYFII
ncbi:Uncharacterized protein NV38_0003704 [Leptospira kirschneri serovar Mozdok]|nr:Uncharacterized protein NV38_0003704 [Leptospira kirschneri serovar Mozdok]NDK07477.1 hypothetical protein [Leptospira kirschneri serovar Mozdok]